MARRKVLLPLLHPDMVSEVLVHARAFVGADADKKLVIIDLDSVADLGDAREGVLDMPCFMRQEVAADARDRPAMVGRYWLARHCVDVSASEAWFELCGPRTCRRVRAVHDAVIALEDYGVVFDRCSALARDIITVALTVNGLSLHEVPPRGSYPSYRSRATYAGKWLGGQTTLARSRALLIDREVAAQPWNTLIGGELARHGFHISELTLPDVALQALECRDPVRLQPGCIVALRTETGAFRVGVVIRVASYNTFLTSVQCVSLLPRPSFPVLVSVFAEMANLDEQRFTLAERTGIEKWVVDHALPDRGFFILHSSGTTWTQAKVLPSRPHTSFHGTTFLPCCVDASSLEENAQRRGWTLQRVKHIARMQPLFNVRGWEEGAEGIIFNAEVEAHVIVERAMRSADQMIDALRGSYDHLSPMFGEPTQDGLEDVPLLWAAYLHIQRAWLHRNDAAGQAILLRGLMAVRQGVRDGTVAAYRGDTHGLLRFRAAPIDLDEELESARIVDRLGEESLRAAASSRPTRRCAASKRYAEPADDDDEEDDEQPVRAPAPRKRRQLPASPAHTSDDEPPRSAARTTLQDTFAAVRAASAAARADAARHEPIDVDDDDE